LTREDIDNLPRQALFVKHGLNRISKDFANWNNSGVIFNNVSDRPRNPDNQADRFELEDMSWFRDNPQEANRMRQIHDDKGMDYILFTAPIKIEPFCLKCHDTAEKAPPVSARGAPTAPTATSWATCGGWSASKLPLSASINAGTGSGPAC